MSSLLRLSIQNMMSLVSVNLMLFVDRIILAKHSTESLNASVTAGSICNIFIFGAIAIVGIGDVFIGQSFGAKRTKSIGEVLWQLVWFCAAVAVFFCAIALVLTPYLYPGSKHSVEATYFSWQMSLGFLPVLGAVLTSFFVGTKRFGFALFAVIIQSTLKLLLEFPLVFGVDGLFAGLGVKGAILANALSQIVHIVALATVVINKDNRIRFGSLNWRLRPRIFVECMKLGFPQSVGSMLSATAWGIVVSLLAAAGEKHLMMYTIIDSFYNLLGFATEGLQKSVLSLSANLIGSGKSRDTSRLFHKAIRLLVPILFLLSLPLLVFPQILLGGFNLDALSSREISLACLVIWLYFGFDGVNWILTGLLTAMGDTLFVNPINALTAFVGVGATYLMTVTTNCRPEITCLVTIIYGILSCTFLFLRYLSHNRQFTMQKSGKRLTFAKRSLPAMNTVYGRAATVRSK